MTTILIDTTTFLLACLILSRLPNIPPTRAAGKTEPGDAADSTGSAREERRWLAFPDPVHLALTIASAIASVQYWALIYAGPLRIVMRTAAPRWMAAIVLSGPLFLVAWVMIVSAAVGPSAPGRSGSAPRRRLAVRLCGRRSVVVLPATALGGKIDRG